MDTILQALTQEITRQVNIALEQKLTEMKTEKEEIGELIKEDELCKRLSLSRTTISTYRRNNKIPYLKVGNNIRYEYEKVVKALER
jgi:excisionase family DNA binding protein